MLAVSDLKKIAKARLEDANVLYKSKRYDGAIYLLGYAVEIGLKLKICKTLEWTGFPEIKREFEKYQSFKTHDLDSLLHLSGIERDVKETLFAEWSAVAQWDPEVRYSRIGNATAADTKLMLRSSRVLLRKLL